MRSIIAAFLLTAVTGFSQQYKIDSLNAIVQRGAGKVKVEALIELAKIYGNSAKPDNKVVLGYATQAREIALEIRDTALIVTTSRIIGQLYNRLGWNKKSFAILSDVLPLVSENKYRDDYKKILNNLSSALTYMAEYDQALEYSLQALRLYEEDNELADLSLQLNNIAIIFYKLGGFEDALKFYQRAYNVKTKINDRYDLDRLLINTGLCYQSLKNYDSSIVFINKGLQVCNGNCREEILMEGQFGLGMARYQLKEWEEAEKHFKASLSIARKISYFRFISENQLLLAVIYRHNGQIQAAIEALRESETIAKNNQFNEVLLDVYKRSISIYSELRENAAASDYKSKYIDLKDSVYSSEMTRNLMRLEAEYLERENKARIESQAQIITLKDEVISRQQYINVLFAALVLMFIVVIVLLYRNSKNKQAINSLLELKVRERTEELARQNASLMQANGEKEQWMQKTSQMLRNSIATISGICNTGLQDDPDIKSVRYLEQVNATSESLNQFLRNMITTKNQIPQTLVNQAIGD